MYTMWAMGAIIALGGILYIDYIRQERPLSPLNHGAFYIALGLWAICCAYGAFRYRRTLWLVEAVSLARIGVHGIGCTIEERDRLREKLEAAQIALKKYSWQHFMGELSDAGQPDIGIYEPFGEIDLLSPNSRPTSGT